MGATKKIEVLERIQYKDQIWFEVKTIEAVNARKEQITILRGGQNIKPSSPGYG